ncbi:hypothetical protein ACFQPF_02400 [Fictibacillus iocasae]|uniref:Uncharacterized protein n=1 Tax=Fictibacillus iocasae TaxID=2715437 RepID=A0ABW2NMH9_9BACL
MKYVFEQAVDTQIAYYLTQEGKIIEKSSKPIRMSVPKLSLAGFSVEAGKVITCLYPDESDFYSVGAKAARLLSDKGMTTMLTSARATYHHEIKQSLKRMKHTLNNAAVDYLIGVTVAANRLTPEFVKECNRERVPFILFKVSRHDELLCLPWEWLREANYLFRLTFVPDFSDAASEKARKSLAKHWKALAVEKNIPYWTELYDESSVPDIFLKKIGLYPVKGTLMSGSDTDYTLSFLNYDEIEAAVIRGRIVYLRSTGWMNKGIGKETKIRLPGRFGLGRPARV